jgi:enamine deaminase RidA (YjgF/YER057c/UK114 family)
LSQAGHFFLGDPKQRHGVPIALPVPCEPRAENNHAAGVGSQHLSLNQFVDSLVSSRNGHPRSSRDIHASGGPAILNQEIENLESAINAVHTAVAIGINGLFSPPAGLTPPRFALSRTTPLHNSFCNYGILMSTADIYTRLDALGIVLPTAPAPVANFDMHVLANDFIFVSGLGPVMADGTLCRGRVADDISIEEARAHARIVGINLLAVLHGATNDLNRIVRVVKLLGFVNSTPDFQDHPKVIDGCSDLLTAVLGSAGRHARSAVGMSSLPFGISVEIEGIVMVRS